MAGLGERLDELAAYLRKPSSRRQLAMLVYPPEMERHLAPQLSDFVERLKASALKVMVIDVNHIVNDALRARLEDVVDAWDSQRNDAKRAIAEKAGPMVIESTSNADRSGVDVIIWTRVGGAYPFLRVAPLMERLIGKISATLVVMYPGSLEGKTTLRLLDERDGYQYRPDYLKIVDA